MAYITECIYNKNMLPWKDTMFTSYTGCINIGKCARSNHVISKFFWALLMNDYLVKEEETCYVIK